MCCQKILNFLRRSQRNRIWVNWLSRQRILNFLGKKRPRNRKRVNRRSRQKVLNLLRKSQRSPLRVHRSSFQRILNLLRRSPSSHTSLDPGSRPKSQQKMSFPKKKQKHCCKIMYVYERHVPLSAVLRPCVVFAVPFLIIST